MIYRKKEELETVMIESCMGGKGIVRMEKLLYAPEEMLEKGRAYVRHTLEPGVSNGKNTNEGEMETMVIVSGNAEHTINGEVQELKAGDIIAAMPGDTHGIVNNGEESLVLIAQVLYE